MLYHWRRNDKLKIVFSCRQKKSSISRSLFVYVCKRPDKRREKDVTAEDKLKRNERKKNIVIIITRSDANVGVLVCERV